MIDGQVMTPMQKIVADSLRPEDARDPYGVDEARATLDRAYALLDDQLTRRLARRAGVQRSPTARAAPALFYARVVHRWDEAVLARLTGYFDAADARARASRA